MSWRGARCGALGAGRSVRGARCGALAAGRSLRGALAHRRRHLRDRLGVTLHSSQTAAVRAQFRVREAGCRARLGLEATLAHLVHLGQLLLQIVLGHASKTRVDHLAHLHHRDPRM